ncbi:helix-turn-helix domain-containing protein [Zobellella denitrificans]
MKHLVELAPILKQRRQQLSLNQKDMLMRIGMSQQQYQRIEAGGDPRLSTLLRIAEGMGLELLLVPREQAAQPQASDAAVNEEKRTGSWDQLLGGLEDD